MLCLNCQKETSNPKFCSRNCSAIYNNKKYHKRKPEGRCLNCETPINSGLKFCKKCTKITHYKDKTIKEVIYKKHHRSSAFALIRFRARQVAKKLNWTTCKICGYNKHVEISHIKPISEFTEDTLISIVNSQDNLIALCPNCHWEFDNGLIKI